MSAQASVLKQFPPMGIYEILFSFLDTTNSYLGTNGTHPWAQGFPLTSRLPGAPALPDNVSFSSADMKYPPATGAPELLGVIRDYYNHYYGAKITTDNIAIFPGGRPAIFAILSFLNKNNEVLIEETEYTPYFDVLKLLECQTKLIPSNEANGFRPTITDYKRASSESDASKFVIKSNPCNPTGVTWIEDELKELVEFCSGDDHGGIIDEAYEFFHDPKPVSAIEHVKDLNETNLFIVGAATKGLQVPGMRTGWVIASEKNIEIFRNYSSLALGGVSRASQIYVSKMLGLDRVDQSRKAVGNYFNAQRKRYQTALEEMGVTLYTGPGGFYHWGRLPNGLKASELNTRLFKHNAAILPGTLCDMARRGDDGPMGELFRFSFGALLEEEFDETVKILKDCITEG
ncbi:hypothetical protein WH96_17065 [Kiloniella spongiae]|uniref:aspartate transaminase n=1 Tax=Kiloniella spongiae TaxID=1489064 RepID=A0A0H2MB77_9PROT|nr:pyridoxal phosphate-dependent aminotransferase [Kiloniella spongiae]KLN59578.1 hypothetical protein WH96_17065 [Kiloniella spongiae]